MNISELSEVFKSARIAARLTQQEVARLAGVSPLLVSMFERQVLTELGVVKLLALLRAVGLELSARPAGEVRTLNDVARELDAGSAAASLTARRTRVRHPRARAP